MRIRQITPSDFETIRKVDKSTWAEFAEPKKALHARTLTNVLTNWEEDPHGCFVAEEKHEILGYVFSHTWGRLGWTGTFGVRPEYRGKGVGKKLLQKSVEYLESNGCRTIGLETRPENAHNVGMYVSCGFRPKYLTLVLSLPSVDCSANEPALEWSRLEQPRRKIMTEQFLSICHSARSGLDYTKMGRLRVLRGEGKIVAFGKEEDPYGFAVVRTVSQRVREQLRDAFVEAMVIRQGSVDRFPGIIRTLRGLARKWGKSNVIIPANTQNLCAAQALLGKGFRVCRSLLRMTYKEQKVNEQALDLSLWIM